MIDTVSHPSSLSLLSSPTRTRDSHQKARHVHSAVTILRTDFTKHLVSGQPVSFASKILFNCANSQPLHLFDRWCNLFQLHQQPETTAVQYCTKSDCSNSVVLNLVYLFKLSCYYYYWH